MIKSTSRTRTAAAGLLTWIALTACSSAPATSTSASPSLTTGSTQPATTPPSIAAATVTSSPPSSTLAATPPPTVPATWTQHQAQTHYLAIVAPINKSSAILTPAIKAGNLSTVTALCNTIAAQEDTVARQLTAGLWPVAAQTRIETLVTAATASRTQFQNCAAATTLSNAITALNDLATYSFSAPAEAVRIAIGLPGN